jgi:DNA-binding CsgD family transcriptional regulator
MPAVARMAAEQGAIEHAVRISGAIEQMHETIGGPLKAPFRERYERNLATAMRALGPERFRRAFDEGRALSPTQAVQAACEPVRAGQSDERIVNAAQNLNLPLSAREREVMRLVPGRTAKEIGQALFISESTVRTHIEHILNKLGLRNQKELISFIAKNGLA